MTDAQRKEIFGRCRTLGMTEDDRRALIFGLTGKESTKELTASETEAVIRELRARDGYNRSNKRRREIQPGYMTAAQCDKVWSLIYRLRDLDEKPMLHKDGKPVLPSERLTGAIKKILDITVVSTEDKYDFFMWISFKDGEKLIERLKQYVNIAEKKAKGRKNDG